MQFIPTLVCRAVIDTLIKLIPADVQSAQSSLNAQVSGPHQPLGPPIGIREDSISTDAR